MLKRFVLLAGLTLLLGVGFVPAAHASTHFSVQIGAGVPWAAADIAPGYAWQPGHYIWAGFGYRWVPGAWVPLRGNWARERWAHERRDFYRNRDWDRGRDRRDWDRNRDRRDWDSEDRGHWRR